MLYRVLQRQMNASIYMCLYASAHMWNTSALMRYVSLMSLFGVPSDPLSGALSDPLFGAPSEPPTEESGVLSEESIVCRVWSGDCGMWSVHLLKTSQKYCACHTKRLLTRYETRLKVTKCHAGHAKQHYNLLPHRHGEATGKPETRDETRWSIKTSISCETSSNFNTL